MLLRINKKIIENVIFFCVGLLSTMPILHIYIGTLEISAFRMIFVIAIMILLFNVRINRSVCISKGFKAFYLFLIMAISSSIIGGAFFYIVDLNAFSKTAISYIPKVELILVFTLLLDFQEGVCLKRYTICILQGIFWGLVVNVIWSVLDALFFYLADKSLNNLVFSRYIDNHLKYGASIITSSGLMRSSGFNFDPAHIGYIAPVILGFSIIKKNFFLMILSVGGILASGSTTALVSCVIVFVYFLLLKINKIKLVISKKISFRKIIIVIAIGIFFLTILFFYREKVFYSVKKAMRLFSERIDVTYGKSSDIQNIRILYIEYLMNAIANIGLLILLGTGFGTASYGYMLSDKFILTANVGKEISAFDMENTYICYLLDIGIIGVIIYTALILKIIKENKKKDDFYSTLIFSSMVGVIVSALFYHYVLFMPQVLIIICSLSKNKILRNNMGSLG